MKTPEYASKELVTTKQIDRHFRGRRFFLLQERDELLYHASLLPKLLLAGKITGLELLRFDRDLQERITKVNNRLRMNNVSEGLAQRQKRKEGSAWV